MDACAVSLAKGMSLDKKDLLKYQCHLVKNGQTV